VFVGIPVVVVLLVVAFVVRLALVRRFRRRR
jgi:hypothetical protein